MTIEQCMAAAEWLRENTPSLDEMLDRLRAMPEPELSPWPPPPLDPLPEPRPIPGTNLAVIDGLAPHPPVEQQHRTRKTQHIAKNDPPIPHNGGNRRGERARKDRTRGTERPE